MIAELTPRHLAALGPDGTPTVSIGNAVTTITDGQSTGLTMQPPVDPLAPPTVPNASAQLSASGSATGTASSTSATSTETGRTLSDKWNALPEAPRIGIYVGAAVVGLVSAQSTPVTFEADSSDPTVPRRPHCLPLAPRIPLSSLGGRRSRYLQAHRRPRRDGRRRSRLHRYRRSLRRSRGRCAEEGAQLPWRLHPFQEPPEAQEGGGRGHSLHASS